MIASPSCFKAQGRVCLIDSDLKKLNEGTGARALLGREDRTDSLDSPL